MAEQVVGKAIEEEPQNALPFLTAEHVRRLMVRRTLIMAREFEKYCSGDLKCYINVDNRIIDLKRERNQSFYYALGQIMGLLQYRLENNRSAENEFSAQDKRASAQEFRTLCAQIIDTCYKNDERRSYPARLLISHSRMYFADDRITEAVLDLNAARALDREGKKILEEYVAAAGPDMRQKRMNAVFSALADAEVLDIKDGALVYASKYRPSRT